LAQVTKKAKKKTIVNANGIAHIKATFNNVVVTLTDVYGNTLAWSSAGKNGFKGSKKTGSLAGYPDRIKA